jgi:hypothetical protein
MALLSVFVSVVESNQDMNQKGLPVRISKRIFQGRTKGNLHVEFGKER